MVGLSEIVLYECVPYHIWLASVKLCCTSVYHTIYGWHQRNCVIRVCTIPYMVGISEIVFYECVPYHIWLASAKLCFTSVYDTIYV